MPLRALREIALLPMLALCVPSCDGPGGTQEYVEPITLPNQFVDGLVTKVTNPTALAFVPDGRLLITSQNGTVRVFKNGSLLSGPAIDLTSKICNNSERGVLGVAIDPDFASNKFVFLYYTFKKNGNCNTNDAANGPVNRVSRFTYNLNNDTMGGEQVLLDNILSLGGNHNAGDIHFGADGKLYISVGDSGCQLNNGSACGGGNKNATSKSILNGKMLRINNDGSIPSDNPWVGQAGARRCGEPGTDPGYELSGNKPCVETYAWGLRNPFRFAFNPAGTTFYIDDVGQNVSEEIDQGAKNANYGWPTREGWCANGQDCSGPSGDHGFTEPLFSWDRNNGGPTGGCKSITGGAFVPSGVFGAYAGKYLFSDYVCGKIFAFDGNTVATFATALGGSSAVDLVFGPGSQGGTSLYYTTYAGGGEIHEIRFTGTANRPPTAKIAANPTSGPTPLAVAFDGSNSSDPDSGDTLTYTWTFGDGSASQTTTSPTTSHTYAATGNFTAKLVVKDNHGASSPADTIVIAAGNSPPTVTITSPSPSKLFTVGETLTLSATATDAQDGNLPGSAISWTVLRHHNDHTHPYFTGTGASVQIAGPPPEDLLAATNSYLEIHVTATDSGGLATTVDQNLNPKKINLTFQTSPTGLSLVLDNTSTVTAPTTVVSWQGWGLAVNAPAQSGFTFQSWSDGGAAQHVIATPGAATTYTATFAGTGFSAKINFQPTGAPVPAGYAVDDGAAFGARAGGLKYGWNGDNSANTRDRDSTLSPDQRYDTLIHMQKPSLPNAVWEIEVPNGTYDVHVVQGDAGFTDSVFRLNAEGTLIASGTPSASKHWIEGTGTVTVSDGRLTLSNGAGASNNKLCFVDIAKH
jgi:glucose/arabinose dehydrogenase